MPPGRERTSLFYYTHLKIRYLPRQSHFLMNSLLPVPRTKLFKFNFPLYLLFVLASIKIDPFADGALEADQFVGIFCFGHLS